MPTIEDLENAYKKLRSYLNPAIHGPNTDAILRSIAGNAAHLIESVQAVNDSLYIVTARERFLDRKVAEYGLTRPELVGIPDEIFRKLSIAVINRKQIRDLIHVILGTMFGSYFANAHSDSSEVENYELRDGDSLIISFDDEDPVEIFFYEEQFSDISNATAQEIASVITTTMRRLGRNGYAITRETSDGIVVSLVSNTEGTDSAITVLGGRVQNVLRFDTTRDVQGAGLDSGNATKWQLTQVSGGGIRATWIDGEDPIVGKVRVGDYVTIYGNPFDELNQGTFPVTAVQGGTVGNAYVEFTNINGISEVVTQEENDDILFHIPSRKTLLSERSYTAVYQTHEKFLQVFVPVTTIIGRYKHLGVSRIKGIEDTRTTFEKTRFQVLEGDGATMTLTNLNLGITTDAANGNVPGAPIFDVIVEGTNITAEQTQITFTADDVADSYDGTYWTFYSSEDERLYYVWYDTGAGAGDPEIIANDLYVVTPDWATTTAYANGAYAKVGNQLYRATDGFVSGATFQDDLDNGYWEEASFGIRVQINTNDTVEDILKATINSVSAAISGPTLGTIALDINYQYYEDNIDYSDNPNDDYLADAGGSPLTMLGPYLYNIYHPYVIGTPRTELATNITSNTTNLIDVTNSTDFPDERGYIIFGWGTDQEEGPIEYIARPSSTTLMIDPAHRFQYAHQEGTSVDYVEQNATYKPKRTGLDYPFYLTDAVSGREYARDLIRDVAATGITVAITILYPDPEGLSNWTRPINEQDRINGVVRVWETDRGADDTQT